MKIVVNGVELAVTQARDDGRVKAVRRTGRDRRRKRNVTDGITLRIKNPLELVTLLKLVAALPTARCTCNYRYGYSDHAEHCQSIHVAREYRDEDD